MNPNFLAAVARRILESFKQRDAGFSIRNRVLLASCLFQLARIGKDLSVEEINHWLRAAAGRMNGFSHIRLREACSEFKQTEPAAFAGVWSGDADSIYEAFDRLKRKRGDEWNILRWSLLAIAGEYSRTGVKNIDSLQLKLEAEKCLDAEEATELVFLKADFVIQVNAEFGHCALTGMLLSGALNQSVDVEVIE